MSQYSNVKKKIEMKSFCIFCPSWDCVVSTGPIIAFLVPRQSSLVLTFLFQLKHSTVHPINRVSKTHGQMDACPRKIFCNQHKPFSFEHKTGKTGTFSYFWYNLTTFCQIFYVLQQFQCINLCKIKFKQILSAPNNSLLEGLPLIARIYRVQSIC